MTFQSATEQLIRFIRHGYAQSYPVEQTYYLTTPMVVMTGGTVLRGLVLRQPLEDQLQVIGFMLPWMFWPALPANLNMSRIHMFNFQVEGSQEWFFSDELATTAFVPDWPSSIFSRPMPYVLPRPFILNSNSAIVINATDLNGGQGNYFIQFCFVCIRTGYPRKER